MLRALVRFAPAAVLPAVLLAFCAFLQGSALASCANEALRVRQHSSQLPECRAWELVSPAQKNGTNVSQLPGATQAAPSGEALAFASSGSFAGSPTSLSLGLYRSQRSANGWSTRSVDIPQSNVQFLLIQADLGFSEDLTHSFEISRRALAEGAVEGQGNAYVRDNDTAQQSLIATSSEESSFFDQFAFGGETRQIFATPDYHEIAFSTEAKLTPNATAGERNVYEWSEGKTTLASILPGEQPAPEGASGAGVYPAGAGHPSRLFFTAQKEGVEGLYMREGSTTIALSASQRSPHKPLEEAEVPLGSVATARFAGASADGSLVYLTSSTPLTDSTGANLEERLYRYEVATHVLTALTKNPTISAEAPEQISSLQVSDEGTYVYFSSNAVLAPGASQAGYEFRNTNLYVWHGTPGEQGQISFIAQTNCQAGQANGEKVETCPEHATPQEWDASPNGKHFAFSSYSKLTSYPVSNEARCPANPTQDSAPGACTAVYDYNVEGGPLRCLSCDSSGAPPAGYSRLDGGYGVNPQLAQDHTRNVLEDGRVFFDSPNNLTPDAVNGHEDLYQSQPPEGLSLLSSGTSAGDVYFADASTDGSNVFFRTSDRLVSEDTDSAYDVYDARREGGLESQNLVSSSSECRGDECQGAIAAPPALATPGTTREQPQEPPPTVPAFYLQKLSSGQRTRLLRTGRLAVSVKVSTAGLVSGTAKAKLGGRSQLLAHGSRYATQAGVVTLTLEFSRAARRAIAQGHRLRVDLSVSFSAVNAAQHVIFAVARPAKGR